MSGDKKQTISGTVQRKISSPGSKSEHEAFYLVSGSKQYLMRKPGGNPFETAADFGAFEGKQVKCTGIINEYVFFVDEIKTE